jgi:hypothetical protein
MDSPYTFSYLQRYIFRFTPASSKTRDHFQSRSKDMHMGYDITTEEGVRKVYMLGPGDLLPVLPVNHCLINAGFLFARDSRWE